MSIITLLTDFGTKDEYVGVMKGVILSINPSAVIVDVTHHIGPQNVVQASYMVQATYPYFPKGTVHIVVVDPGVGSDRSILAVKAAGQIFVAPDNGVLTALMDSVETETIVRVENTRYFLTPVSHTFHGRDIFAPVGAYLAKGARIQSLGTIMRHTQPNRLRLPQPQISASRELIGTIIAIDRFGNLMTNIDSAILEKFCRPSLKNRLYIRIGEHEITGLSPNYSSVPPEHPLAVMGSRGFLEIGVNCGSARETFNAGIGEPVKLVLPRQDTK